MMKYNNFPIEALHAKLVLDEKTGFLMHRWGKKAGERAGSEGSGGYRSVRVNGIALMEHRVVWAMLYGKWPDGEIDHINCVRNDNRPENLREATHGQNHANKRKPTNNNLGAKGVSRNGSGYRAQIRVNGKQIALGTYRTIEEASEAYALASRKYYGEFGRAA